MAQTKKTVVAVGILGLNPSAGAGGGLFLSWPIGTAAGLVWSLLVYPARRVAVGRDLAGRVVLCREWPAAAVGDESTERRGAWVRVHAYLAKLEAKRAAVAARRRLGFPLPSVKAKA